MNEPLFPDETPEASIVRNQFAIDEPLSSVARLAFAEGILRAWREVYSPIEIQVRLKYFADILTIALENNKEDAINANREGETILGATVVTRKDKQYDYSDDTEYNRIEAEISQLKEQLKARMSFVKSLKSELVDPKTGETSAPPKLIKDGTKLIITLPT